MRIIRSLLFLLLPVLTHGQLTGKVVSIADGDTFTMLVNKELVRIRLHGIDAPEKGQDFYKVAKAYLSDHIFEKTVSVQKMKMDRYKRTVGIVFVNGLNVNEALLKAGLAWHYKKYDNNPAWAKLAEEVRKNKNGLWVQPNAIPPWDWRELTR